MEEKKGFFLSRIVRIREKSGDSVSVWGGKEQQESLETTNKRKVYFGGKDMQSIYMHTHGGVTS
jgi:hypothetical protein